MHTLDRAGARIVETAVLFRRRCYGMEIDPRYCRVAIARWEAFSGEKAEKVSE